MTRFMHAIALGFLFHPLCLYASPVSYRIDTSKHDNFPLMACIWQCL